jgi:hypothetical protein
MDDKEAIVARFVAYSTLEMCSNAFLFTRKTRCFRLISKRSLMLEFAFIYLWFI